MDQKTFLTDTPENIVKKFHRKLIQAGIPVERMILFGSYAKKNPHYGSDVDVCVVSKTFGRKPFDEFIRLVHIAGDIETSLEPHPFHPRDLADKYDPLAAEIRKYGIQIV